MWTDCSLFLDFYVSMNGFSGLTLNGFGVKPIVSILFRFVDIAFDWSFNINFNNKNKTYFHSGLILKCA